MQDPAICHSCGYPLDGLDAASACPECGGLDRLSARLLPQPVISLLPAHLQPLLLTLLSGVPLALALRLNFGEPRIRALPTELAEIALVALAVLLIAAGSAAWRLVAPPQDDPLFDGGHCEPGFDAGGDLAALRMRSRLRLQRALVMALVVLVVTAMIATVLSHAPRRDLARAAATIEQLPFLLAGLVGVAMLVLHGDLLDRYRAAHASRPRRLRMLPISAVAAVALLPLLACFFAMWLVEVAFPFSAGGEAWENRIIPWLVLSLVVNLFTLPAALLAMSIAFAVLLENLADTARDV